MCFDGATFELRVRHENKLLLDVWEQRHLFVGCGVAFGEWSARMMFGSWVLES